MGNQKTLDLIGIKAPCPEEIDRWDAEDQRLKDLWGSACVLREMVLVVEGSVSLNSYMLNAAKAYLCSLGMAFVKDSTKEGVFLAWWDKQKIHSLRVPPEISHLPSAEILLNLLRKVENYREQLFLKKRHKELSSFGLPVETETHEDFSQMRSLDENLSEFLKGFDGRTVDDFLGMDPEEIRKWCL